MPNNEISMAVGFAILLSVPQPVVIKCHIDLGLTGRVPDRCREGHGAIQDLHAGFSRTQIWLTPQELHKVPYSAVYQSGRSHVEGAWGTDSTRCESAEKTESGLLADMDASEISGTNMVIFQ